MASAQERWADDIPLERISETAGYGLDATEQKASASEAAACPEGPSEACPKHSDSLPSLGSLGHDDGLCKPCAYNNKPQGCRLGSACRFCHLCPPREVQRRKQVKRNLIRCISDNNRRRESAASLNSVMSGQASHPVPSSFGPMGEMPTMQITSERGSGKEVTAAWTGHVWVPCVPVLVVPQVAGCASPPPQEASCP
mmetsp:Transcript_36686/g.67255  ORF Transcript_36686/g.67255 Transcript_36686/m.67255 type:complete len:197 (-) Transcript_36686:308-898(-)